MGNVHQTRNITDCLPVPATIVPSAWQKPCGSLYLWWNSVSRSMPPPELQEVHFRWAL